MHPSLCPKDVEFHLSLVTAAKAALDLPFSTRPSLLMRTNSGMTPPIAGVSISWRMKLSSICSRNLLDFFFPAVFSLQQISGCLKVPMRTRFVNVNLLLPVYRGTHQPGPCGATAQQTLTIMAPCPCPLFNSNP